MYNENLEKKIQETFNVYKTTRKSPNVAYRDVIDVRTPIYRDNYIIYKNLIEDINLSFKIVDILNSLLLYDKHLFSIDEFAKKINIINENIVNIKFIGRYTNIRVYQTNEVKSLNTLYNIIKIYNTNKKKQINNYKQKNINKLELYRNIEILYNEFIFDYKNLTYTALIKDGVHERKQGIEISKFKYIYNT